MPSLNLIPQSDSLLLCLWLLQSFQKVRNLVPYMKKLPNKRVVKLDNIVADPLQVSPVCRGPAPWMQWLTAGHLDYQYRAKLTCQQTWATNIALRLVADMGG